MTKRSKTIGKRLFIARESNGFAPPLLITKCENFLTTSLKLSPASSKSDDVFQFLEAVNKAAKRIARAIHSENLRKKAGLSDSRIEFEEIREHHRKERKRLLTHAKAIGEILDTDMHLPPSVRVVCAKITQLYITPAGTAGSKTVQDSLCSRLKRLVNALENEIHPEAEAPIEKIKKGPAPFRLDSIRTLVDAWCDLTGKKPEKRKRSSTGELI